MKKLKIVLASASPRRKELLETIVPQFDIVVSQADETLEGDYTPEEYVAQIAARKTQAVAALCSDAVVIGSDTVVVQDGVILGKPVDAQDACAMLAALQGREHHVYTAVHIITPTEQRSFAQCTGVQFAAMSEQEISWYVATGEPMDKAGAYGIQGKGGRFIEHIRGDYYAVMGLPVQRLYQELKQLGVL